VDQHNNILEAQLQRKTPKIIRFSSSQSDSTEHARGGPRHSVYDEMNDTSMSDNLEKLKKKAAKNRGLLDKMAEKGKSEKARAYLRSCLQIFYRDFDFAGGNDDANTLEQGRVETGFRIMKV